MDAKQALREASAGLLFRSESEYPFEVVALKGRWPEVTRDRLLQEVGLGSDCPSEEIDLDHLFRNVTTPQEWHEESERQEVVKFRHLLSVLKGTLSSIRVFRLKTVEIDLYILGRSGTGEWIGLKTTVIET